VGRGRDFDVADGQTERGKYLPNSHLLADGLDALGCTDTTDLLVLEARKHGRQHGGRPDGIIISETDDIGRGISDPVGHLKAFVGKGNGQDANTAGVDRVGELLEGTQHALFRNNQNLLRLADKPRVGRLLELLASINGGDNDGDIFGRNVGGVLGDRNGTVGERCGDTNNVPEIPIKPVAMVSAMLLRKSVKNAPNDAKGDDCG
jgi:hypothetical protein